MELLIVYRDEHIIAVYKPAGLLVHRSPIARDASEFLIQILRDQVGQKVYPCHRLDRKTSGILLCAFSKEIHAKLRKQWEEETVSKQYKALVRGILDDKGEINYDLTNEKGKIQSAVTFFCKLEDIEINVPFGKHQTSRYSLVELTPTTGRFHQIRKHMAHIFHPIIGDRPHGCNKQNRFFLENWDMKEMCLHATQLNFTHPVSGKKIQLKSEIGGEFDRIIKVLKTL